MSNLLKNLLFALGLSVLLWLGYVLFVKDTDEFADGEAGVVVSPEAQLEAQEFVARLNELKDMDIDSGVTSEEKFKSLEDFRVTIEDEPKGRRNPFAPVE